MITVPIAVCLGFRNWHLLHLDRCLASLTHQQGARFADICVYDLGSDDDILKEVILITRKHGLSLCLSNAPRWSRSLALNRAARMTDAPWLLFTDADMIFPDDYAASVHALAEHNSWPESRLWLTRSRDLPEPMFLDLLLEPPLTSTALRLSSSPHDDVGQGGGMLVPREWFMRVGGFDEQYQVWGAEDNDLVLRARWDGLLVEWLPDTFVAHQWHSREATPEQMEWVHRNRAYLRDRMAQGGPIVRNVALARETTHSDTQWCPTPRLTDAKLAAISKMASRCALCGDQYAAVPDASDGWTHLHADGVVRGPCLDPAWATSRLLLAEIYRVRGPSS